MRTPHIQAVDLVKDGLVVTYDDQTRAFYDESVLLAHLEADKDVPARRRSRPAAPPAISLVKKSA